MGQLHLNQAELSELTLNHIAIDLEYKSQRSRLSNSELKNYSIST